MALGCSGHILCRREGTVRGPHGKGYSWERILMSLDRGTGVIQNPSFLIWAALKEIEEWLEKWSLQLQIRKYKLAGFPNCMVLVKIYCHKYTLDWSEHG